MLCLVTQRALCPTPLTSEQVRSALWLGLYIHGFTLVSGIIGAVVTAGVDQAERESLLFTLDLLEKPSHACAELLALSMILLLICGVISITCQFMAYPKISAFVLPISILLPWGLAFASLLEAVSIDVRGYHEILVKSLVRESYIVRHRDWLGAVFQEADSTEWDEKLQAVFQCCGIVDKRDWFFSACNCIPPSCCRHSNRLTCETRFVANGTYAKLEANGQNFTDYEHLLWEATCLEKVQEKVVMIRDAWVNAGLWFTGIEFWIVFLIAYLCYLVQELNETDRGRNQLQEYKWSLPTKKSGLAKDQLHLAYQSLLKIRSDQLGKSKKQVKRKHLHRQQKQLNPVYRDFIEIMPPGPKKSNALTNVNVT